MNVLITGGTGNLGSRLAIPLVQRGDRVAAFDIRAEPHFDSAEFREAQVVVGDLADRQRVIFSSTIATYGANLPEQLTEDAPQWPVSLYGVTKVAGERLGVYYHHQFGLDFRAVR